jgi:hypothetical protein
VQKGNEKEHKKEFKFASLCIPPFFFSTKTFQRFSLSILLGLLIDEVCRYKVHFREIKRKNKHYESPEGGGKGKKK